MARGYSYKKSKIDALKCILSRVPKMKKEHDALVSELAKKVEITILEFADGRGYRGLPKTYIQKLIQDENYKLTVKIAALKSQLVFYEEILKSGWCDLKHKDDLKKVYEGKFIYGVPLYKLEKELKSCKKSTMYTFYEVGFKKMLAYMKRKRISIYMTKTGQINCEIERGYRNGGKRKKLFNNDK